MRILAAYNNVIKGVRKACFRSSGDVHELSWDMEFIAPNSGQAHYDAKDPHYWYYVNLEDPNEAVATMSFGGLFLLQSPKAPTNSADWGTGKLLESQKLFGPRHLKAVSTRVRRWAGSRLAHSSRG